MGVCACVCVSPRLPASHADVEIVHPRHRVWFSVVTPLWYVVGYVVVPGIAYAIRDYQRMLVPFACVSLLLFSYYW